MREWLKDKRLGAGLTQEQVAMKSGIARTTYAMYEQGERNPSVGVAVSIADVLKFKWTIFLKIKYTKCVNRKNK